MNKLKIFTLLIFLAIANSITAQISSAQIDELVENAREKFNVAGVAVAIVKDGKTIHSKGYGVKSLDTKEKVDEHTNFAIASNSKAFTTAALALLVEERKLSWDDKVKDHIPEFRMYNDYVTENFNIQDLLTHRSGLGLGAGDLMFFPDGSDFTIEDVLGAFQHFEPESAFRTKFDYDNLLYLVAGEVTARISGMSWEEFIQKRILQPLRMDNTYSTLGLVTDIDEMATPYTTENGALREIDHYEKMVNGAAGGIISNVDDLSKWMLLQLNEGKYGNNLEQQLFSAANQKEMWTIHTPLEANSKSPYYSNFRGYGLGWFLTDYVGKLVVSHTGGLPGMLSKTILIPDLDLGIVVLTNTSDGGGSLFSAVTLTLIDEYLGLEEFGWTEEFYRQSQENKSGADAVTEKVWERVKAAATSNLKKEDYTGVYEDNWFGKVEVFIKNDQLWFRSYRSPKLNGPMNFYNANTFAIKWEYQDMPADAFAMFSLDEEGKAHSIKMKGISPNIDFSFDFQDLDLRRVD